jgi:5-formyltetrahydrofolate cyclo-ligase
MGKGFYDYSLSDLNNKSTELIVIAFEFQKIDDCLHGKHDVKANSCITDEYFYNFD